MNLQGYVSYTVATGQVLIRSTTRPAGRDTRNPRQDGCTRWLCWGCGRQLPQGYYAPGSVVEAKCGSCNSYNLIRIEALKPDLATASANVRSEVR